MSDKRVKNIIVFGDSQNMKELKNDSVHLVVTSPPYFNAPFDYPDLFKSYDEFLTMIRNVARELMRVLKEGRIAALVVDDILIKGKNIRLLQILQKYLLMKVLTIGIE
jgi:DNA methylase.